MLVKSLRHPVVAAVVAGVLLAALGWGWSIYTARRVVVSMAVIDRTIEPGRDDIELAMTNQATTLVVVEPSAILSVGGAPCAVTLSGGEAVSPGEIVNLNVDGSLRFVKPRVGSHQCELYYRVLQPSSGVAVDKVFRFTCEREKGLIIGPNQC